MTSHPQGNTPIDTARVRRNCMSNQEAAAVADEIDRLRDLLAVEQLHDTYTPEGTEMVLRQLRELRAREHCETCQGRNRETTDMVCMTCGRDYMPDDGSDVSGPGLGWLRLMGLWREQAKQMEGERETYRNAQISVEAELNRVRAEIAQWEAIFPCSGCNPYDGDGPREECPRHGREYAYWVDGCTELSARCEDQREQLDRVRALPACRDTGHTEAIHLALRCCDPYDKPCVPLAAPPVVAAGDRPAEPACFVCGRNIENGQDFTILPDGRRHHYVCSHRVAGLAGPPAEPDYCFHSVTQADCSSCQRRVAGPAGGETEQAEPPVTDHAYVPDINLVGRHCCGFNIALTGQVADAWDSGWEASCDWHDAEWLAEPCDGEESESEAAARARLNPYRAPGVGTGATTGEETP